MILWCQRCNCWLNNLNVIAQVVSVHRCVKHTDVGKNTSQDNCVNATLPQTNIKISSREGRVMAFVHPEHMAIVFVLLIEIIQRAKQVSTTCANNIVRWEKLSLWMEAILWIVSINSKENIVSAIKSALCSLINSI